MPHKDLKIYINKGVPLLTVSGASAVGFLSIVKRNPCGKAALSYFSLTITVWIGYRIDDEGKKVRPVAHAGFEDGYLETVNINWTDTERGRGPTPGDLDRQTRRGISYGGRGDSEKQGELDDFSSLIFRRYSILGE